MKNSKIFYGWFVVIAVICFQAGLTGIMTNCTGILFAAILEDMGFRAGDLSIYYTIKGIAMAATVGITSKLYFKLNSKFFTLFLTGLYSVSYIMMFFFSSVWQWYISAVIGGIGSSCIFVVAPIIINNWFAKNNGLIIGISMAGSGVAGALFSPVLSVLISSYGWRTSAILLGIIGFVIVAVPNALFLQTTPESMGLKPFGYEKRSADAASDTQSAESETKVLPKGIFFLCAAAIMTSVYMTSMQNQLTTFAATRGFAITTASLFTSAYMVGNIGGKLLIGGLADKIGVFKATNFVQGAVVLSMIIYIVCGSNATLFAVASVLLGLLTSVYTNTPALTFLAVYGKDKYRKKLSSYQAVSGLLLSWLTVLVPYIYDFTGSFTPVLFLGIALTVTSFFLFRKIEKITKQ